MTRGGVETGAHRVDGAETGLHAHGVHYHVRGGALLTDVSLQLNPREVVALIGPNGAGKSTLLRVLAGEHAPSHGEVRLHGRNVRRAPLAWLAGRRAVMAQSSTVAFAFTVEEVLRMGWTPHRHLGEAALAEAEAQLIAWCELTPLLGRRFSELSGGEQQRVQFARALMQVWPTISAADPQPRLLLLDEPTASLDLAHERLLLSTVRRLTRDCALGVVVVLHDLNLAARFADRVVLLSAGRFVAGGAPAEVFEADLLSSVYRVPITVGRLAPDNRLIVSTC